MPMFATRWAALAALVMAAVCTAVPVVEDVYPAAGRSGGGTVVTIIGKAFGDEFTPREVFLGRNECTDVEQLDIRTLRCTTTVLPSTYEASVVVLVNGERAVVEFDWSWQFLQAPVVTSLNPIEGRRGKTTLTVNGDHFGPDVNRPATRVDLVAGDVTMECTRLEKIRGVERVICDLEGEDVEEEVTMDVLITVDGVSSVASSDSKFLVETSPTNVNIDWSVAVGLAVAGCVVLGALWGAFLYYDNRKRRLAREAEEANLADTELNKAKALKDVEAMLSNAEKEGAAWANLKSPKSESLFTDTPKRPDELLPTDSTITDKDFEYFFWEEEHQLREWEKLGTRHNVDVYRKRTAKTGIYQFRVEALLPHTKPKWVFDMLDDPDLRVQWEEVLTDVQVLGWCDSALSDGQRTQVVHTRVRTPNNMPDREFITHSAVLMDDDESEYVLVSKDARNYAPLPDVESGVERTGLVISGVHLSLAPGYGTTPVERERYRLAQRRGNLAHMTHEYVIEMPHGQDKDKMDIATHLTMICSIDFDHAMPDNVFRLLGPKAAEAWVESLSRGYQRFFGLAIRGKEHPAFKSRRRGFGPPADVVEEEDTGPDIYDQLLVSARMGRSKQERSRLVEIEMKRQAEEANKHLTGADGSTKQWSVTGYHEPAGLKNDPRYTYKGSEQKDYYNVPAQPQQLEAWQADANAAMSLREWKAKGKQAAREYQFAQQSHGGLNMRPVGDVVGAADGSVKSSTVTAAQMQQHASMAHGGAPPAAGSVGAAAEQVSEYYLYKDRRPEPAPAPGMRSMYPTYDDLHSSKGV